MPAVELDLKTLKRKVSKAAKRSAPKKSKSKKGLSGSKKMYAGATGALARKASAGFMDPEKIASAVRLDPVTMKRIK